MSTLPQRFPRRLRRKGDAVAVACALFVGAVALLSTGIVTGEAVSDDGAILRVWPMTELGYTPPPHSNSFLYDATYVFTRIGRGPAAACGI
jgi:hypothetical protein